MNLIILSLASYRLTRLFVRDTITESFRNWLGRQAAGQSLFWWVMAEIFHCAHCLGVWISAVLALYVAHDLFSWFLYTFAIAGTQGILTEWLDD